MGLDMKRLRPVLIVEDEGDYASLIRESFESAEVPNPVQVVGDADQAIAYLAGEREFADRSTYGFPCLMLLDLRLSQKSGFHVLRWLRNRPDLKQRMNVIVLSSVNTQREIQMAYELGAQYFMKKSDFNALVEKARYLRDSWISLTP